MTDKIRVILIAKQRASRDREVSFCFSNVGGPFFLSHNGRNNRRTYDYQQIAAKAKHNVKKGKQNERKRLL